MDAKAFRARFLQRVPPNSRKEDFVFKKVIANGNFGKIYQATHSPNGREYAIKSLDKEGLVRTGNEAKAYREKQLLMNMSNPFVINCEYYFVDNDRIYLATPFMPGGDVYGYIMWSGRSPNENTAKFFSAQVLLALEYLHSLNILHRDIKPENLMLDDRGYIKLIDFGYASVFKNVNYTMCGTIQYMAPEMLLGTGYGRSVDYWALGILIHELCAFELPFDEENPDALVASITAGNYPIKKEFSSSLIDLLSHLLDVNPISRFGCREDGVLPIKNHQWFASNDFNRLFNRSVDPPELPSKNAEPYQPTLQLEESRNSVHCKEFDNF